MNNEIAKQLVDECRDKCVKNIKEMYEKIDTYELTEHEKHVFKVLLRSRVSNYLWAISHPQAMDVIYDNIENKDYLKQVKNA